MKTIINQNLSNSLNNKNKINARQQGQGQYDQDQIKKQNDDS